MPFSSFSKPHLPNISRFTMSNLSISSNIFLTFFSLIFTLIFSLFFAQVNTFASGSLVINEFLPAPTCSIYGNLETVELYNSGSVTVDLSTWKLKDSAVGGVKSLGPNTATNITRVFDSGGNLVSGFVVPIGGFVIFTTAEGWLNNTSGDTLNLIDGSSVIDSQSYTIIGSNNNDIIYGRSGDNGSWMEAKNISTFGRSNSTLPDICPGSSSPSSANSSVSSSSISSSNSSTISSLVSSNSSSQISAQSSSFSSNFTSSFSSSFGVSSLFSSLNSSLTSSIFSSSQINSSFASSFGQNSSSNTSSSRNNLVFGGSNFLSNSLNNSSNSYSGQSNTSFSSSSFSSSEPISNPENSRSDLAIFIEDPYICGGNLRGKVSGGSGSLTIINKLYRMETGELAYTFEPILVNNTWEIQPDYSQILAGNYRVVSTVKDSQNRTAIAEILVEIKAECEEKVDKSVVSEVKNSPKVKKTSDNNPDNHLVRTGGSQNFEFICGILLILLGCGLLFSFKEPLENF